MSGRRAAARAGVWCGVLVVGVGLTGSAGLAAAWVCASVVYATVWALARGWIGGVR